jgi:hypothetical protein
MPLLNVGDKLTAKYAGEIVQIVTIDRVTPKRAFAGSTEFDREYKEGASGPRERGRDTWSSRHYCFTTPEHREIYAHKKVISSLKAKVETLEQKSKGKEYLEQALKLIERYNWPEFTVSLEKDRVFLERPRLTGKALEVKFTITAPNMRIPELGTITMAKECTVQTLRLGGTPDADYTIEVTEAKEIA